MLLIFQRAQEGDMKTVLWTVFIGGTLAGGSPNQKPATKSPGAERSEARSPLPLQGEGVGGEGKPLPTGEGLGVGEKPEGCGEPCKGAPH